MNIVLKQVTIRDFNLTDAQSIAVYANDREIWLNQPDAFPHPYKDHDAQEWIELISSMQPCSHFALDVEGKAVGGIGFKMQEDVHRRSAEIGYWLGREFWGRGIATEAVKATTEYAFKTFDLCRVYACVFAWNPASAKVLEKCGYLLEGRLRKAILKDGKMTDGLLYAYVR
jgi:RimJ/RimL family protein N-acetyltransferase